MNPVFNISYQRLIIRISHLRQVFYKSYLRLFIEVSYLVRSVFKISYQICISR